MNKHGLTDIWASTILAVEALNGRDFATLTPDELELFKRFRAEGRKHGLWVGLVLLEDDSNKAAAIWLEMEGLSLDQKDEIYRRNRTRIEVRGMA